MTFETIIAEVQAIDTTNLDSVVAALAQVVTDLQTLQSETSVPVVEPVTVTGVANVITFSDGSTQNFPA
jgi:hypothetical protein